MVSSYSFMATKKLAFIFYLFIFGTLLVDTHNGKICIDDVKRIWCGFEGHHTHRFKYA